MAYNLEITEHTDQLIERLTGYLIQKLHNVGAALHLMDGLDEVYSRLEDNPYQFPESTDPVLYLRGYHEALVPEMAYRIVFRVQEQTVYIVGVFHELEDYGKKVME